MEKSVFYIVIPAYTKAVNDERHHIKKYIGKIPIDYNLSNVLLSVIYAKYNLRVKYLSITFRPRQGGKIP